MFWKDPDRWVDADMQRDEWLRIATYGLAGMALLTVIVLLGWMMS